MSGFPKNTWQSLMGAALGSFKNLELKKQTNFFSILQNGTDRLPKCYFLWPVHILIVLKGMCRRLLQDSIVPLQRQ